MADTLPDKAANRAHSQSDAIPRPAKTVMTALAGVADVLYPPVCPICRAETGAKNSLCPNCWRQMAFIDAPGCQYCSRPIPGAVADEPGLICEDCTRFPPLWQRGAAVFRYEGAGRRLVLGLKHGDRLDTVAMLGAWALRSGRPLVEEADLIAPVPLHWTRRIKRRGNQSAHLARWLAGAAGRGGSYAPRLLRRIRRTPSQDGKSREERHANLRGALTLAPDASINGRQVLLVDDVLTTGATLNAATSLCLKAGARSVDILVLALVIRDRAAYIATGTEDEVHESS